MRKYMLASKGAKDDVDLREYQQIIQDAVHEVLPHATVQVEATYYTVSPTPKSRFRPALLPTAEVSAVTTVTP